MVFSLRAIFIKFHLVSFCLAEVDRLIQDDYQDYSSVTSFLSQYTLNNSDLMTLYSIGQSVLGRELWVVSLTGSDENEMVPNIKVVGNIHGNEPVGREISLELIKFLVVQYKAGDPRVKWLLDSTIIHILPSMNPDGFERALKDHRKNRNSGSSDTCNTRGGTGRTNEGHIDLNKNFPGAFRPNTCPEQPESRAVMKWMNETQFVLSLSLHSGSLLVNYPFDDISDDRDVDVITPTLYSRTPDDDVFQTLAVAYAKAHSTMHRMTSSCNKPRRGLWMGTTNGAQWSPMSGGMQDYNYVHHGCLELTIELACCRFPRFEEMGTYWNQNSEAILTWASFAHRGVKGVLYDSCTKEPVAKASLKIMGRQATFWSNEKGEFWRPLLTGNYQLQVRADGFKEKNVSFTIRHVELNKKYGLSPVILRIGLSSIAQNCDLNTNFPSSKSDVSTTSSSYNKFSTSTMPSPDQRQSQNQGPDLGLLTPRTNHERATDPSHPSGRNETLDIESTVPVMNSTDESQSVDENNVIDENAIDIDSEVLATQTFQVEASVVSGSDRATHIFLSFPALVLTVTNAARFVDLTRSVLISTSIKA